MLKIQDVLKLDGKNLIICTPTEQPFLNSKKVLLYDNNGNIFETTKFDIASSTPCFTDNIHPGLLFHESIPEQFLVRGNDIELL